MKFCLVDRVVSITPGESIRTIKQVSLAEEYLQDHFPGFAVLPGVLMVECMVQSCAWLSRITDNFRYSTILLKQARAVRFNSFLKPGEVLEIEAKVKSVGEAETQFMVSGTKDGQSAVSARLTLTRQNLADRNAQMADNDRRLIAAMREQWGQLSAGVEAG